MYLTVQVFSPTVDYIIVDSLAVCTLDATCFKFGDDYCINGRCIKNYGFPCKYDRQSFKSLQTCINEKYNCKTS